MNSPTVQNDTGDKSPSRAASTAQHTPGPWTLRVDSEKHYQILDEGGFPRAEVFSAHRSTDQRKAEALANARLIAAAPELLEAARLANQELLDLGVGNSASPALNALWAAIAKVDWPRPLPDYFVVQCLGDNSYYAGVGEGGRAMFSLDPMKARTCTRDDAVAVGLLSGMYVARAVKFGRAGGGPGQGPGTETLAEALAFARKVLEEGESAGDFKDALESLVAAAATELEAE